MVQKSWSSLAGSSGSLCLTGLRSRYRLGLQSFQSWTGGAPLKLTHVTVGLVGYWLDTLRARNWTAQTWQLVSLTANEPREWMKRQARPKSQLFVSQSWKKQPVDLTFCLLEERHQITPHSRGGDDARLWMLRGQNHWSHFKVADHIHIKYCCLIIVS